METKTSYIVVPRKRKTSRLVQESLQSLRRTVSRSWTGQSATAEIRSQRKRSK